MTAGELDAATVRRHLLALDAAVVQLRKYRGRTVDELRSSLELLWVVERGLQLCAQNVLDVATHVAVKEGMDVAEYAAAIDALGQLGVVSPELAGRLRGLAGFRNVLVHGYLEVDVERLHALLDSRLDDFVQFAAAVDAWLRRG